MQGAAAAELQCRVIPGLARDDAFVLIAPEAGLDAGTAYDNLMQVIRADLRDPLREAHASLEVARRSGDAHEIDLVADGVAELVRVLDRLVDLAELWGSGALLASDRIELWPLLQSVWAEIEPLAVGRSVKVRFRAQGEAANLATIYGSESWLRRVFLECLESAVRSERAGGTLEIEHRQLGPRAVIVFRDCGVFAHRAENSIELKGSVAKGQAATRGRARDQIGLKLCQHILALHGGQLRDEQEDGECNFVIDLPTGAPHHSEESQLDIAQAQRYASDLAALMARARHRSGDAP
jgi:K+-sensing histidine kinase KdpD